MGKEKILVVEDEAIIAIEMQTLLRHQGYEVPSIAASGEEAIRKAEEDNPDLILMDIVLQGEMDGIEAARQIRSRFDIPLIYITAYSSDDIMERIKETEPSAYIIKPINDLELASTIELGLYRHKMEKKLRESEGKYRSIVENIPGIAYRCLLDKKRTMIVMNDYSEQLTGYPPSDFINNAVRSYESIIHREDTEYVDRIVKEAIESGKPWEIEYRIHHKDGSIRWVHEKGRGVTGEDSTVKFLEGVILDITDRKQTEEELLRSREFTHNVLDTVDEGFVVIDRDYRIISTNNAYCRQMKLPVEDIIGKYCYEISHGSDSPCYENGEECSVRHTFETGLTCTVSHKHQDKDGNIIYVEVNSFPLKDASGEVISAIEAIRNITDKHLLEEQLLRTQKLEAVGILAGGIAHDFNNLLQGVFGTISMAKMFSEKDGKAYQMLENAEKMLDLTRSLTNQLLTFSKGGEPIKRTLSLSRVVQESAKFALSGSNINYSFSEEANLWPVEADEGQINQVIQNIVLNASNAMPEGGTVRINISNALIDEQSTLPLQKGNYVLITIEDSGIGIPESHIGRIFDPYFTTKQKGSGLGLATSYSIIKNHNGIIDVRSQHGVGSTFFIYLPASDKKTSSQDQDEKSPSNSIGKILIMDDDEMVRTYSGDMITALGSEVDFAADGVEAIEKYSNAMKSGNPFDVVILDLTIRGGMGGMETLEKLVAIDPDVRAVVSSGYAEDPVMANFKNHGFKAVLTKPYKLDELSKTLQSVIE